MIKAVLFDLDGTLLPMDMEIFTKSYFKELCKKMLPYGYQPEKLVESIWTGTTAMVKNDGKQTNEVAFWNKFKEIYGEKALEHMPVFEDFYANEFNKAKDVCGYNEEAHKTVKAIKNAGYRLVLATNPIFPDIATDNRIKWAGLDRRDFELVTTYENSKYCKPNIHYYRELLAKLDLKPEECIMVGNDVNEDLIAEELGMAVFLLTDCLINKDNKNIDDYAKGSFAELRDFLGL